MRLIIVSNRLPVNFKTENGKLKFESSPGGLASGLSTYLNRLKETSDSEPEYIWVGWPGIPEEQGNRESINSELEKFNARGVMLKEEEMDNFYHGFCNKTIWPLFHYFPYLTNYKEEYWENYKYVNQRFCDAVMEILKPGDVVWVHDYHLMLLPKLLRQKINNISIGFFLHIPFPSFEVFRLLPNAWRKDILEGMLGADLIGFHTHDYTAYFLRCVLRILGLEHALGQIIVDNRIVNADTFPMGIDFLKFNQASADPQVRKWKSEQLKTLSDYKVILSIDRLDYTKGITNRLLAYESFLSGNPNWRGKVVLVMVVVPSRVEVEQYKKMKKQIDELVGKINGKFGNIHWSPILYQYTSLPFHALAATYSISDVALVTPLRDGMNLVAKEYIASRTDKTGVLILSEIAGSAEEMGEAILINPNYLEEISMALKEALEMPVAEQIRRNEIMQSRLKNYNVVRWADDFMETLYTTKESQKKLRSRLLTPSYRSEIFLNYNNSNNRIIFLDYDGTLVPYVKHPDLAKPGEMLMHVLGNLAEDPATKIVLVSGRDRETMNEWFGKLDIEMVAEHGVWIKEKNDGWQLIKPLQNKWKSQIIPILKKYTEKLPGSFIEDKEFSCVFHFRQSDPEVANVRVRELIDHLVNLAAYIDLQVLRGNKVVEVKSSGINKGIAALHWMQKDRYDFIMAIGDDRTDEDLFKMMPADAYSIKVGEASSYSRFNLYNQAEVLELLDELNKGNEILQIANNIASY